MASLMFATIFVCWFINQTYLDRYYKQTKVNSLETIFEQVQEAMNEYEQTGDYTRFYIRLEQLADNSSSNINVFDAYQVNGVGKLKILIDPYYPQELGKVEKDTLSERVDKYFSTSGLNKDNNTKMIKESKDYKISRVFDTGISAYYIELWGKLSNGLRVFIRVNFDSIKESVSIFNRFLGFIGFFVTLIGTGIMLILTRRFTDPILELSNIASDMSNLNFNRKYMEQRNDEIGVLGSSINTLSERLEHTISELKSANNQLQVDIANKVQIDEMRKEFLSNITHELKTPIAVIQGYAEGLMENVNEDPESRDFYCEVIKDEAIKMNNMVKKLLSLNQIESGNNILEYSHFNIVDIIRAVLQTTDILIQQKNVTVQFETEEEIMVWAEEYMIEEVITNYISNALNHVKEPNLIKIKCEHKEKCVRVSVFNTGNPIPQKDLENIWIKFYKVDKARTREYGGSGIGLSIVKAIMIAHNQNFGVINQENGVEFWFEVDTYNG